MAKEVATHIVSEVNDPRKFVNTLKTEVERYVNDGYEIDVNYSTTTDPVANVQYSALIVAQREAE